MNITIRKEETKDHRIVEELTREAFWNLHVPGCDEHYLVHILRNHPDFVPELDFVAESDGRIVGHIMYTRSAISDDDGNKIDTLTFGPVSVLPEYQRKGIGSMLIQHTCKIALTWNIPAIIIHGNPKNYVKHDFKVSKDFVVSDNEGRFPYYLLVKELRENSIPKRKWHFVESDAYRYDPAAFDAFESTFPAKKKEITYTQYEFEITSRAYIH